MKGNIKTEGLNIIPHLMEFPLYRGEMKQVTAKDNPKEKDKGKDKDLNADVAMEEVVRTYQSSLLFVYDRGDPIVI